VSLPRQLQRAQLIERYLRDHPVAKLQIGAGENVLAGWLNTDLRPSGPEVCFLDATVRFPFSDEVFDYVLSEHQIEHIPFERGQFMLAECRRVLRPGGRIRIATPSLEVLAGLVTEQPTEAQRRYVEFISAGYLAPGMPAGVAGVVNNAFRNWGHQFLYDRSTLAGALTGAGFGEVVFTVPGRSEHQHFQGVEGHGDFLGDEEMNRFETMVVEGRRD
jgi:predicted SAM-dependent methyltransferase